MNSSRKIYIHSKIDIQLTSAMENTHILYIVKQIQLASSVPGRIAFYGVIWGRFDHLEILLKVLKTSFSFLILINIDQNFHENNFWSCRPRGCKTVGPQSFAATGSRKSDVVAFPPDLGTSIDLKSVDQVTTNQTWLF